MHAAGAQVRLKSDPGRVGTLTGRTRERAGTLMYQVSFPEGTTYQPDYEIELLTGDDSDVYGLLEAGKFGRLVDLRRNLSHIQLSGRLANLVYSMDATNTDFYAYQFKPVIAFLESPANGILIADEVGLGKTIEAGLIWTELRARYDARRLVVICPAMLREKWKDELRIRFDVEAEILDAGELYNALKVDRHNVRDGRAIVCSLQGLRPPKGWQDDDSNRTNPRTQLARLLDEQGDLEPLIDLLIVDEAHYLRNPDSQTAKLGQMMRAVSEHVVLLSATPVNLKEDDLFYLLNIVDPDSFDAKEVFPQVLLANEPLLKARALTLDKRSKPSDIKQYLLEAQSHSLLGNSGQLKELVDSDWSSNALPDDAARIALADKIDRINILRNAVTRTRKIDVTEWKVVRDPWTEFVELSEEERDFYERTTSAIREYAQRADISEGFMLASPQRQISSCMVAAAKSWLARGEIQEEEIYEDLGIDVEIKKDYSPLIEFVKSEILPQVDVHALRKCDSKYRRFSSMLKQYLTDHPHEKVIVFSFFRGTLSYLKDRLYEAGIKSQVLVGGMTRSKQEVIDEFRENPAISVLLSSEVASEGVDLQFSRLLVNYDLPWNPMKVEQRIGRIDRLGQEADKISIWNLCYANTIDHKIYERLFLRLGIFERALGGLEAVLGEQIEKLTNELITNRLTDEQQNERIDKTALAIERNRADKADLENQASHLIAHGGYILEQVQAAHDLKKRITAEDLLIYVKDYLDKYSQGHTLFQVDGEELLFDVKLSPDVAARLGEFARTKKLAGISALPGGDKLRCVFSNKLKKSSQRLEIINQFHPMIRFISQDLKDRNEAFYPLVALQLDQNISHELRAGIYVFAINVWSFSGLRTEEEIKCRVVPLRNNARVLSGDDSWNLINAARNQGRDWLSAANEVDLQRVGEKMDECADQVDRDYQEISQNRKVENSDRVLFQINSAQRHRDRQLRTHNEVLERLKWTGKTKLIPARKGLINKVNERFEIQIANLKAKSQFASSQFELCFGVIKVE